MLQFNIKGDNIEVTPAIRDHIERKVEKIERYFPEGTNANAMVNLKAINNSQSKVEITIPMKNLTLRAEERHDELYAAVDLIVSKLERQIRKYKTKVNRKGKVQTFAEVVADAEPAPAVEDEKVIKTKTFALKPMDEEEAIMQMELLEHDFFVFLDAESNGVNVVYKRKDGQYGLIVPTID